MTRKIAVLAAFATLGCARADDQPPPSQQTAPPATQRDQRGVILFLGTSLTAGYGIGVEHAFPALIQLKLDSAALPYRVVNAGLSGETSAGGLRRLEWSLQHPIDVLVLELGANDGLRGLPVAQLRANLDSIITITRRRYPDATILIAGMRAPPNLGPSYTNQFRETYRSLAREHRAILIPFLLEDVAAVPGLNQEDGMHPNREGHQRMAETIWRSLQPALRQRAQVPARRPAATK